MGGMVAKARSGMVALLTLASLGFGATQALATPPEASAGASCIPEVCSKICKDLYGRLATGKCVEGVCECSV